MKMMIESVVDVDAATEDEGLSAANRVPPARGDEMPIIIERQSFASSISCHIY